MSLLNWRRPDPEHLEPDSKTIWMARGFGGDYMIEPDSGNFIVWLDDDAFAFETFGTIDRCKQFAECRFCEEVKRLAVKLQDQEGKSVEDVIDGLPRGPEYVRRQRGDS